MCARARVLCVFNFATFQLTVTIDRPSSYYHKEIYFFKPIKPELCKVKYLSDKIEFKIKKAVKSKEDWESLEGKKEPVASAGTASFLFLA